MFSAGYVYLLFDIEKSVRSLLQACTHDFSNGDYFYKISSRRMRSKEVSQFMESIAPLIILIPETSRTPLIWGKMFSDCFVHVGKI